ncbi:hypothetical protein [Methanopyrus sp. SNP6]|uniref:hypothetical protein n=1 Tax=Methanopyrus sp. SNP6 TaxID=1937005 RepID=UPI00143C78A9|nr:hypothetical protein [Methanopyrus sp. SNP6]
MLPSLVFIIGSMLSPSTATVYVHVVPYIDSDAWSKDHVTALKEFLSWCEGRGIKVAVFHYNVCEDAAPGITDLIREYAGRGTISLVGLHSTSHALGGLPLSLQYWELEFNLRFLRNRVGSNVSQVLSVPSWTFDANTLYACHKLEIRVMVCGVDITAINPDHDPTWDRLDPIARHMLVGYFNVCGDKIYYVPALSYVSDLVQGAEDRGTTVRELLQNAVRNLIDGGAISTAGDVHLVLWILVHPWELADANVRSEFENFLSEVGSGSFNFEYQGIAVTFELSDPREVVDAIQKGTNIELVALPEPDYSSILHATSHHHWWELVDLYPDRSEIVWEWLDTVSRWWVLDPALWDLTVNGVINDSILEDLYRAVKWVWDEALLEDYLKYSDPSSSRWILLKERKSLDTVYREILALHAEMVGRLNEKQQDLERRIESLERELQGLKKRESKRGLPVLPSPLRLRRSLRLRRFSERYQ